MFKGRNRPYLETQEKSWDVEAWVKPMNWKNKGNPHGNGKVDLNGY